MKRTLNRLLSLILTAALFVSVVPTQAFAVEETEVYLPEIEIGSDILDYDVFYLATAAASVEEGGNHAYLLRVGRGGPADSESSVLVKIADMTAKYGEDYVVRVRDERTKVDNPEDNFSLMEMIEDSDFEQKPISDSDEFAEMIQDDPDAQAAYREGVETAMEFLEEASGLSDKYDGEDPYAGALEALYGTQAYPVEDEDTEHLLDGDAEPAESDAGEYAEGAGSLEAEIEAVPDWENGPIPANGDGETLTIGGSAEADTDPLRRAVNFFTGRDAAPQRLTAEGDMFQDLQAIANVMTNVVVGASVTLTFAPGETEKYLEILPKDNRTGDGDRMFYVILGAPGGRTTNSAASTCAFTIVDDEEAEPAVVSFSDTVYHADSESVTVTVERSGTMNTVISAKVVTTGEGTARAGRDYSEVDAELVFPFGVNHLTLDIPVRTDYLTGEGSFGLALEPTAGCVTGENDTAAVYLDGSYTDKASLYAAQSGRTPNEPGTATLMAESSAPVDENNLSTYKTLSAINIRNPLKTESYGTGFKGINAYNNNGFWQTKWKGGSGGTVRVAYELTSDYWQSYFLAGAEVNWWRSYGCGSSGAATMKVSLAGKRPGLTEAGTHDYIYQESYGYRSGFHRSEWYSFNANWDFDGETRYIYPTYYATNPIESNSRYCYLFGPMWAADHPQAIDFLNVGVDDDCSQLWLWGIKPILRPFQVNIKAADPLIYLKADGTRSEVTNATTTDATIVEAGSRAVLFQNDSFTVSTTAGPDVSQYGYLSAIRLMNGADENKALYTLATNGDPSNTSIQYTLNTDNMQKLISSICPDYKHGFTQNWYNLLRENPYAKENRSNVDGYPTYVLFNVKPEFSYINSSVTLRNPYDFPVTMTISGTDYRLAARETRKIKAPDGQEFHLGDTLAVTKISLEATDSVLYTPVGVKYWAINPQTNEQASGAMNFADGKPVNFAGFDGDGRLRTKEIIVEPNLQVSENRIQVRIKTSLLSKFDTSIERDKDGKIVKHAGVLAQEGTVNGEYTYFTFADETNTVNGRLYAITATPLSENYVAEWYDSTTMRTYVGNTLYFTAMDTPERNVITLSVAPVAGSVTLEGTLYYKNYNLRTGYSGNASNVPAIGAALSAGSAGGMADQNGHVTAGPVPVSDRAGRYLRYMVSINGSDIVQELLLPVGAGSSLIWDFGSDETMSSSMGAHNKARVDYSGGSDDEGNDFYTFTATGNDPYVSVETPVGNAADIPWVKIRAKNLSGADAIELFACLGSDTGVRGDSCVHIPLQNDTEWHDYIVYIPDANVATVNAYKGGNLTSTVWKGKVNWLRLDPMEMENGSTIRNNSRIQIDYVAFFDSKETAKKFRAADQGPQPSMLWDFGVSSTMDIYMHDAESLTYTGEMDKDGNDYYIFTPVDSGSYYHSVDIDNFRSVGADDLTWVAIRARNMHIAYSQIDNTIGLSGWEETGNTHNSYTGLALEKNNEWCTYVYNLKEENQKQNPYIHNFYINGWIFTPAGFTLSPVNSGYDTSESSTYIDYIAFFPDEESAKAFRSGGSQPGQTVQTTSIDISANFPSGVSPVNSAIFGDIQITGKMSDSAYQVQDNTYIPVVPGKSADMTIRIKPAEYSYTMTGEKGAVVQGTKTEYPVSVQLVVYDSNDVFKGVYDAVDSFRLRSGYMTATSHMDFVEPSEGVQKTDENGKPVYDEKGEPVWLEEPVNGILPEPGDKLYLRLVTDRLLQAEELADGEEISGDYRYSDIFTGMYFYQPTAYERPPEMGIRTPIEIEYGNLPLIGSTGMDLAFPFVSVGIMKIQHGYRIYIGVSPVQIMDTVKGTHVSAFSGAGGEYWKSLFSIKSPFQSFSEGLSKASETIGMVRDAAKATAASNKANGTNESVGDAGLGSHSWRFDISLGMYFDFINPTVTQDGISHTSYVFNGMGGYVSVTLGFTMAWYIVLPVVFLPAYLGIEMQGTVMGYLGATFNKDVEITYADALNGSASINDGITELTGGIRGYGYVQISLGVGLCGTLGVRASGKVNLIANWEPNDPNGPWGAYIGLQAGLVIDLFLFSIPLMYSFAGWPFGSFEYYSNPEKHTLQSTSLMGAQDRVLMLRESSGEDSMWLGDQMLLQGAFRPNKQKEAILAVDPYERPDSQLITLSDGKTLALAFIDSDSSKAVTQRTTLKLSIYDADTGLWSAPVPVSADKTADFQPSIAETKDGRLLVAWVSASDDTITDISTDEQAMKYLDSMDVYAAFVELDGKAIKTKTVNGVTVADTEVTRISNDRIGDYYDANPTVVCDMESGDAIVYYIKSERAYMDGDEIGEYINPYTNDSVVSYMIYSAQGVEVTKTKPGEFGAEPETETIIEHWLFDYYYPGERDHNTAGLTDEEAEMAYAMLISFFGGQRFLDGPVNNENERYAIPDFTAIGYDGLSICAYTIDPDGSSDTDTDKELYLQVYDFQNHRTKYQTILTNNSVSDTLPQLFRSRVNTDSGAEAHTKLFWYRDGKQVVYIDVTELLWDGINADGTLKTSDETGTECSYTEPIPVYFYADDSHASLQSADFKTVEDDRGNLYILWTASVTDENGNAAREIFGTGLVEYTVTDQDGDTSAATSGWSKPYRITDDGYHNDELAVAMSGENLITVHNRYREELVSVPEGTEYNGQVDFMPIRFSDMALVAETMEPCGSVETESIRLYGTDGAPVTLPNGGDTLTIEAEVSNNGMNTAQGYKLSLYADDTPVGEIESTDALVPNSRRTHTFQYTLPADVEGLTFKAVVQEMRDAETMQYYRDTDTYVSDSLEARAAYEISGVETYQSVDGFHAAFTVTNTGNAASSAEDTLNVKLRGPANLGDLYTDALYSSGISLSVGESRDFDVPVAILPEMMEDFGFVTALITVQKEVVEQTVGDTELKGLRYLSNLVYADFDLVVPMDMELKDVNVAVDNSAEVAFTMCLGDKFGSGSDAVTYAVDDLTIAKVENGKVVGVNGGETTLHATHTVTGATVSSTVTVTGEREKSNLEITPTTMSMNAGDTDVISYSSAHEGAVTYTSSDTGVVTVDENGNVKAVGAGTATITVTLTDAAGNTYTATCTVTVTGGSTPVSLNHEPAITVEVSSDEGSVVVSATVSGNTATITAPTDAQLAEITDRAGETGAVTIDLSSLPENITAVSIPAKTVKAIDEAMEEDGEGLTVKLPNSTVTFDAAALASIAAQTTGGDLQLNVEPITETRLTSAQKEAVADLDVQAVYNIYLTSGGERITDFGGGKAAVEVKHKAGDGRQPAGFTVWYVAEDGATEKNPTTATKNTVKFIVAHFSDYVVAYDEKDAGSAASCDRGDSCPMNAFDDLDKTSWYHDGVHWALENEIMNGYGGGKFGPNDATSRAMIVTMLHRFEGEPTVDYDMGFADVEDGKWYTEAIRWAAANGIVEGYSKEKFGPNDVLTREQLATILYRYAKMKGMGFTGMWAFQLSFDDASEVSDWAYEAMCWMTMNGIIQGTGNNMLSPKGSAARAQVATMLMRYEAIEQ